MASSVLKNLGQLHFVTGTITYSTGVPSLTSNDGSATIADTGTGNCTVTFGDAFLSAPSVVASPIKLTHAAQNAEVIHVEQATTTTAEFRFMDIDDTGVGTTDVTSPDPADNDGCHFIAVGLRNN